MDEKKSIEKLETIQEHTKKIVEIRKQEQVIFEEEYKKICNKYGYRKSFRTITTEVSSKSEIVTIPIR